MLGILEAVESLLRCGLKPRRTIYLVFGHDEEVGGIEGAKAIAALLVTRGVRLYFVLNEGMVITQGIVPGVKSPVAMVGLAEKGYMSVELTINGTSGHLAMPGPDNPIGLLCGAIHRIQRHPMPPRYDVVMRSMFKYLGPEMAFAFRFVVGDQWLFKRVLEHLLQRVSSMNALLRTTITPSVIKAGVEPNVIPSHTRAIVNCHILAGDTTKSVLHHIRRAMGNEKIVLQTTEDVAEPSPISSIDSPSFHLINRTIRQVFPDTIVAPALTVSGTEARHFAELTTDVY